MKEIEIKNSYNQNILRKNGKSTMVHSLIKHYELGKDMKAVYKNQTVAILELYETDNAHIALPNGDIELVPTNSLKIYPNPTETRLVDNFGGINEPE